MLDVAAFQSNLDNANEQSDEPKRGIGRFVRENLLAPARSSVSFVPRFLRTRTQRSGTRTPTRMAQLEWGSMTEPILDREKLDVYRLSIDDVAASYRTAEGVAGANRHIRDQWVRAAQSTPLNIAEDKGKQNLKDQNRFFEIARGSALECAAIHDMLKLFVAIDEVVTKHTAKLQLRRHVSMLARLIQRTDRVVQERVE